jgi:PAS domain S-box-containing protein
MINRHIFRPNDTAKHRLKVVALLLDGLAVLAVGACLTWWMVSRADSEMRASLLEKTQMVAQAVDVERLQALSGTEADLASPAYQRLKEQLVTVRSTNPLCRFIYLLGRKPDGSLFIFVDSEPATSKDYSPPGQVYDEAAAGSHRAFTSRTEITEGPYTDRWGNWVSALVPIFEPKASSDKDQVLAVFGMDIYARDWIRLLVLSGVPPVLLTLVLALVLLAGSVLLERRSLSDARPPRQLRHLGLALVAAVGIAMTLFAAWMCHDRETHDRNEVFGRLAMSRTAAIAEMMHKLRDTELEGLALFCETNPTATAEEFKRYTSYLTKNPAIQAWEWIPAVAMADKPRFEWEARAAGWKGFEIWQKDAQGKRVPAAERDFYYPVFQVAPLAGNERAVGYDAGSEPLRRAALEEAARTGLTTGTDPITLVQETGDQKGMLIFRPVFSAGDSRRLLGFAVAVLRMGTLLGGDIAPSLPMQLSLLRKDGAPELLSSTGDSGGDLSARHSVKRCVFAFGKVFAATAFSEREPMVLGHHPGQAGLVALLVGLILTSALDILVGVLLRRREELERLVAEMTKNQLIARHARDPLLLVALDGRILECNHATEKLYGFNRAELLQLRIGDLRAPESPETVSLQMQQAQKNGLLFEATHVCKNGAAVPVEVNSQSIFFEGQEMLLSVIRDITERKRAQDALLMAHLALEERVKNRTEELNRSKARLQLLLDSTAEAIYGIDMHGECTFCNSACLRMLGYEREDELLGKNMHWQIHQKHADGTSFPVEECRIFRAFQANEASHVDDEVLWRADGTSFSAEYWSYPQRIGGAAVGAVVTFIDITKRKRAESTVLQNLARAEELTRLKSRFVSMASHELRTPLANIMLASELLKNFGAGMPAQRSQSILADLMTGVSSMVQTLDDLLLAGKLEEGKLPFTPARFALLDFLRMCCLEVQPELTLPSRIEIAFRDAGLGVTADERLLHHVLKNLLENALKYSPPDTKVELRVEAGPDSLTLSVRDRGIGVPVAEREFLFDAFSRASNVGDKPGSGLGLFVAQKCAQAHGGQLRYAPQPDGSIFSVTIPLAATTDFNPTT